MGWTAPRTWVAGEVPTATIMNAHIRDNLRASLWRFDVVSILQTTTSTTYTDLATNGPAIGEMGDALTLDTQVTVIVGAQVQHNTAAGHCIMSYVVRNGADSADVIAVSDNWMFDARNTTANSLSAAGMMSRQTASITAGSYVIRAKYRVTAGTGSFSRRWMLVLPNGAP